MARRERLVRYALRHGVAAACKKFRANRKTVFEWQRRLKKAGGWEKMDWGGRSRRPKRMPMLTKPAVAEAIIRAREEMPSLSLRELLRWVRKAHSHRKTPRINIDLHGLYNVLKRHRENPGASFKTV